MKSKLTPFENTPSFIYFWEGICNQVRSELSHIAMNWEGERKCVLWLELERLFFAYDSPLLVLKSAVRNP